ncbi:ChbG/HpnK family deacetylase [Chitiniphilus purpureus]|uniref:ChbG/HpnK family deacetylase n=1 Tax=Chitiniphilus purpureus TaxID=2981137 RepID=A0ABY6DK64_9NEIS|nr:ChbG/HpnK family deacetylase [Chitiniphilus sp. CD1]UXY14746.1 ChbG/HpnK family deacetylase [Chitiniphilus sp. CD1]
MIPLQQRLGFAPDARVLILHADDIGMCQATVSAWRGLLDAGLLTSASAMAPCGWFAHAAEVAAEYGERADLGLHLTLNCEFTRYRWGPLTGNAPETGLVDGHGYFHDKARGTHAALNIAAAARELAAQVAHAQRFGIDLTHLDSHMLTLFHPELVTLYLDLCRQHRLPPLLLDDVAETARLAVIPEQWAQGIVAQARAAMQAGDALLLDSWEVLPFNLALSPAERLTWACRWLDQRGPGVHCLVGHPADDTPELRALAPDWATRVADRQVLGSHALGAAIAERGFKLVGMRALQALLTR